MAEKYILDQNGARIQSILDFFEGYTFDSAVNFPQYCANLINKNNDYIAGEKHFTGKVYIPKLYITNLYSYTDTPLMSIPNGAGTCDVGFYGHLIPNSNGSGAPIQLCKDLGTTSYK